MSRARTNADQARTESLSVVPHIIPDVLYPAYEADATGAGKLLDGATEHSGAYGTAQTDGRKYYFTNIAGSKPIKDPRIGAHFGSQRHKFKSLQLLEQETATHGQNVYSIDGREWVRAVGTTMVTINDVNGNYTRFDGNQTTHFYEFVGYFSSLNIILETNSSNRHTEISIDGGSETSFDTAETSAASPLKNRYVDAGSVFSVVTGQTLGIHTFKIRTEDGSDRVQIYGCELIAQDTSNVNNIQIPSQNVVSYGKKFTVSGTPHYDPFNGFTNSTTLHSAVVDTATSLGLSSAPGSSASWAISGSNNIRPYNGGRVVKWVDSSGVIKTSVNMMPPNAQNILGTVAGTTEVTTPSATNATYTPIFSDDAIDYSQAEVAKTFSVFEYGNGQANGNTSYRDMTGRGSSSATGFQNIAYVMDDGLTSMSAQNVAEWNVAAGNVYSQAEKPFYYTFIGTGISVESAHPAGTVHNIAQNLPYGTHILKIDSTSAHSTTVLTLDGVQLNSSTTYLTYAAHGKLSFHQPKMPPIPDDAVVIADYMLMADFVVQGAGKDKISKGVRMQSHSRDIHVDGVSYTDFGLSHVPADVGPMGLALTGGGMSSGDTATYKLPYFGTDFLVNHRNNRIGNLTEFLNSDAGTQASISTSGYDGLKKHTGNVLGVNGIQNQLTHSLNDNETFSWASYIVSPIHTSSHYQTFETPFLNELVGGDRNMEQTNLVVTPDGKTWDEVTRDVSYIGDVVVSTSTDTASTSQTLQIFDEWRGTRNTYKNSFNKDFAIAYDRMICLVTGTYKIEAQTLRTINATHCQININGTTVFRSHGSDAVQGTPSISLVVHLKRGDYVQSLGGWYANLLYSNYQITRV